MALNKKLTGVIAGRTVVRVDQDGSTASVQFDDGSVMTVRTASDAAAAATPGPLGRVRAVRQQGTTLDLDYEGGSTLTLRTAEPTSSVIVRARDHTLEYAD
jgi:hypothetical protein